MTERITANRLFTSVPAHHVSRNTTAHQQKTPTGPGNKSFQQVLKEQLIQFSHHAEQRLQQRGIELKAEQMAQLESAVAKAAEKGARDSLIMIQDVALIVNVKNKTVVTAMDGQSMQNHVFTQIDSAVIVS